MVPVMNFDPNSLYSDPRAAETRGALVRQLAAVTAAHVRLERVRAAVPTAAPGDLWRGPAQSAFAACVRELEHRLTEALDAVASAQRHTDRAIATMAASVG